MPNRNLPLGANEFAQGVVDYFDFLPNQTQNRSFIIIPVTFDPEVRTTAIVDTGAEYCVLGPEEAGDINIHYYGEGRRLIGGGDYDGLYGITSIRLEPVEGIAVTVADAAVWVPRLRGGQVWPHPNLIGLTGFLEKVHFAVDPEFNQFYFGAFGEEVA